jgi:hypothetical protein
MNAQVISRLFRLRHELRGHERWTRAQLEAQQALAAQDVVAPPVRVRRVEALRRGALGKALLVLDAVCPQA